MAEARDIDVVVFDVLGTLVDEPTGLRSAIREAVPTAADDAVDELLAQWQRHVELEQRRVVERRRPHADSEVIDAEAARRVADLAGVRDPAIVARLGTAGRRLPPWDDSVAGLERLARVRPVLALSNAAPTALLHLAAYAGLRWHQALSAGAALTYKPAPEVYRLAVDTPGCPPERVLMVAARTPGTCARRRRAVCGRPTSGGRSAIRRRPLTPSTGGSAEWTSSRPSSRRSWAAVHQGRGGRAGRDGGGEHVVGAAGRAGSTGSSPTGSRR